MNLSLPEIYQANMELMHKSIPAVPSTPPGLLRVICLPFQSWGWGICKFCAARWPGICQPWGYSQAFSRHPRGFLSQYNYTEDITEKKQISSSVKDRGLYRLVLDFMHAFLHCLSSQNYKGKLALGSYRRESTFFG